MSRLFYKVKKQTCPAIPVTNSAEDVLYPDALRRLISKKIAVPTLTRGTAISSQNRITVLYGSAWESS